MEKPSAPATVAVPFIPTAARLTARATTPAVAARLTGAVFVSGARTGNGSPATAATALEAAPFLEHGIAARTVTPTASAAKKQADGFSQKQAKEVRQRLTGRATTDKRATRSFSPTGQTRRETLLTTPTDGAANEEPTETKRLSLRGLAVATPETVTRFTVRGQPAA